MPETVKQASLLWCNFNLSLGFELDPLSSTWASLFYLFMYQSISEAYVNIYLKTCWWFWQHWSTWSVKFGFVFVYSVLSKIYGYFRGLQITLTRYCVVWPLFVFRFQLSLTLVTLQHILISHWDFSNFLHYLLWFHVKEF